MDELERYTFQVGKYCCARIMLYHALYHYKHRLLGRLKMALKLQLRKHRRGRRHAVDQLTEEVSGLAPTAIWCTPFCKLTFSFYILTL